MTRWVVALMGSQMGKTESCFNILGKKLDDDPEPILYVGPTRTNVEQKIEPRIMAMFDSSESLKTKLIRGKKMTKTMKRVSGVTLYLGWAGSATELSSQPAAMVLVDELDRMRDIKGEGSVIKMVTARMNTYPDSKGIIDSTPTLGAVEIEVIEGIEHWKVADPDDLQSAVWLEYQTGSREVWAVPCPDCDQYFVPRLKLLWLPENCTKHEAYTQARICCPNCGTLIEDKHRKAMNAAGCYVGPGQRIENGEAVGDLIDERKRTFWVSGLMSPFVSLGERAASLVDAKASKDQGIIQGVTNLDFGELYSFAGDAPEWERVAECRSDYKVGTIPWEVQRVFVAVDVQGNRLMYAVRGWGYNFESWGLEAGEIHGDTKDPDDKCWEQLETLLNREFGGMRVHAMAIDSGFNTPAVDKFARRFKSRVYATVGRDNRAKAWSPIPQDEDSTGKRLKFGYTRWTLDHGYFKGWVHDRLDWPQDQIGAWHIPEDYNDDYCKQIVAEARLRLPGGREKWIQLKRDNHFLDCEYLQVFLAQVKRVQDLKEPKPEKKGKGKKKTLAELAEELNDD